MPILTREVLEAMGFASLGRNVQISDKASIYGARQISIGDNVRIDDFCILSAGVGGIVIGQHIHIAAYSSLIGAGQIVLNDFCNISSRVSIYSSNDDYSGEKMTNPTVPAEFTGVCNAPVFLKEHVIIGCGSVILPGVTLDTGVAVGAQSLIKSNCAAFGIYAGRPAVRIKERSRNFLIVSKSFMISKSR